MITQTLDSAIVSTMTFCMNQSPWIKIKLSKKSKINPILLGDVCEGCGNQQSVSPREARPPPWACGQDSTVEEVSGEDENPLKLVWFCSQCKCGSA